MAELPFDMTPDACESPLLDPGSDGLVQGGTRDILEQLSDYREEGHSYRRIRRDFALSPAITNSQIRDAAEYGRRLRLADGDYLKAATQIAPRQRLYGGIDPLPSRAEWEARQQRLSQQQAQGQVQTQAQSADEGHGAGEG